MEEEKKKGSFAGAMLGAVMTVFSVGEALAQKLPLVADLLAPGFTAIEQRHGDMGHLTHFTRPAITTNNDAVNEALNRVVPSGIGFGSSFDAVESTRIEVVNTVGIRAGEDASIGEQIASRVVPTAIQTNINNLFDSEKDVTMQVRPSFNTSVDANAFTQAIFPSQIQLRVNVNPSDIGNPNLGAIRTTNNIERVLGEEVGQNKLSVFIPARIFTHFQTWDNKEQKHVFDFNRFETWFNTAKLKPQGTGVGNGVLQQIIPDFVLAEFGRAQDSDFTFVQAGVLYNIKSNIKTTIRNNEAPILAPNGM